MKRPTICVVGACNVDLISYVPRLPVMGETLHGTRFHIGFGGKGANQAVMAAKLGAEVTLVTKVGSDVFGQNTITNLQTWGVDTRHVHVTDQAFSGVAPISVDPQGNNSIIIVTGANDLLTEQEMDVAAEAIAASDILVCQLEIPLELSLHVLRLARDNAVTTLMNPAPARNELPAEIYGLSDIFCPNESETAILTGGSVGNLDEAQAAARVLVGRGARTVVLTLGAQGSLLVTESESLHIPGQKVVAKDSTGAGDAFVGSLAFFLAQGRSIRDSMERANRIAAISVQSTGTQTSFPTAKDLPADLLG